LPFYLKLTIINFLKQEKMKKAVFKEDPAKTYFSGEGCYINELFNQVRVFFIHISIRALWQNFIFILSFFKFFDLVISFIF
jgi:hypothetical protein